MAAPQFCRKRQARSAVSSNPGEQAMVKREDYAPYDKMAAFEYGIKCYNDGTDQEVDLDGVEGQAFDRGCEYAMKLRREQG
jgi:hypothetical protein